MKRVEKYKYVSLAPMFKVCPNAQYYILVGQRSNGKTFCVLERFAAFRNALITISSETIFNPFWIKITLFCKFSTFFNKNS